MYSPISAGKAVVLRSWIELFKRNEIIKNTFSMLGYNVSTE